jgi:hypothetical protein
LQKGGGLRGSELQALGKSACWTLLQEGTNWSLSWNSVARKFESWLPDVTSPSQSARRSMTISVPKVFGAMAMAQISKKGVLDEASR